MRMAGSLEDDVGAVAATGGEGVQPRSPTIVPLSSPSRGRFTCRSSATPSALLYERFQMVWCVRWLFGKSWLRSGELVTAKVHLKLERFMTFISLAPDD